MPPVHTGSRSNRLVALWPSAIGLAIGIVLIVLVSLQRRLDVVESTLLGFLLLLVRFEVLREFP